MLWGMKKIISITISVALVIVVGIITSSVFGNHSSYPFTVPPLSQGGTSTTTSSVMAPTPQKITATSSRSAQSPVSNNNSGIVQSQATTTAADDFTIDFPGQPTHTTQTLTSPYQGLPIQSDSYQYDGSETLTYIVNHIQYSSDINISVPKNNLQGVMNGVLSSVKGAVIATSTFETFGGYPALQYELYASETGTYVYSKAILIGNQLYQISVFYQGSAPSNINEFINSFRLK